MQRLLRQHWNSLRPVVTGWLAVLLLLPSLTGLAPQVANAAMQEAAFEVCSQNLDDSQHHRNHHEDCPCCLTHATTLKALAAGDSGGQVLPAFTSKTVKFAEFTASAADGSEPLVPRARGPPPVLAN